MIDLETSGTIYGKHSLLEIGAAVGSVERNTIGTFTTLVKPINNEPALQSKATYEQAKAKGVDPKLAMEQLRDWSNPYILQGAVWLARPAAFDWPWIRYYSKVYLGDKLTDNPFPFKAVCATTWLNVHGRSFQQLAIQHTAKDDAMKQLDWFLKYGQLT